MSLYRNLINSAPKAVQHLGFGIHDSIFISSIVLTKFDKGLPRPNNTYITFSKLDTKTNSVIKAQEINWFNLDLSKEIDMTRNQFKTQMSSFVHILEVYGIDASPLEEAIITASGINLSTSEDLYDELLNLVASDKKKSKVVCESMQNTFFTLMNPFINKTDKLFKLKLTCNKKKFIQLPSSIPFLDVAEGTVLSITSTEKALFEAEVSNGTPIIGESAVTNNSLGGI